MVVGPDDDTGKAPLLLVHPINLRKECWLDLVRLVAAERTCVAMDLPGHGESDDSDEHDLARWVEDCRDLAATLGLERFHAVGGSLGGTIAFCLAAELPENVLSVTAMGSALGDDADDADGGLAELLDTRTVGDLFAWLARAAVAPGAADEVVNTVRHLTNSHGKEVVRQILAAAEDANATAWVAGVRCPVLVLTGEHDTTCPPETGKRMASSVGGTHEILAGVGHLPMLEQAMTVVQLLEPHLEKAEQGSVP